MNSRTDASADAALPPANSEGASCQGVIIRCARADDLEAIGRLTVAAYLADGLLPSEDDPYAAHLADASSRHRDAELWVATGDEALLGTVTFARPGTPYAEVSREDEGEFRMLAVSPSARGRGVGEALVRRCQDRALEEGLDGLVLSTLPTMRAAHRLYGRLGFVRSPDRDWNPRPDVQLLAFSWQAAAPRATSVRDGCRPLSRQPPEDGGDVG